MQGIRLTQDIQNFSDLGNVICPFVAPPPPHQGEGLGGLGASGLEGLEWTKGQVINVSA